MRDEDEPAVPGGTRLPTFLVPALTLLLGVGAGLGGATWLGAGGAPAMAATTPAPIEPDPAEPAPDTAVTNLGSFTINLRGAGGGRVLRLEVQVESAGAHAAVATARLAQVRDAVITAASDYTWSELEGAEGKTRLRDELLARVNGALAPATVQHLYFTQFVVQ